MSLFQWPFFRKQYAGINNPRFVSDIVAANQAVLDAMTAICGLGSTDFAIITGLDYTPGTPGSYAAGIFYLNGTFYYIGSPTTEGLYLIGTTVDTLAVAFQDSVSRNIYTLQQGNFATLPAGASPVLSGNMNQYRIGLKTINTNIQNILTITNALQSAAFIPANVNRVNGTIPLWDNLLTAAQIAASYLALEGGTMTGPLILNADPTVGLGAATKQYADQAAVSKLLWVGDITSAGTSVINLGPTANPLTVTCTLQATGKFLITHNIGNLNYFISAININGGFPGSATSYASPNLQSKLADSFVIVWGDNLNRYNCDFELTIFKWF